MKIKHLLMTFCLLFSSAVWADLPTQKEIQAQIESAKAGEQTESVKAELKVLEETLSLLDKLAKQQSENNKLQEEIDKAPAEWQKTQAEVDKSKQKIQADEQPQQSTIEHLSLDKLEERASELLPQIQQLQKELTRLNGLIANQKSVPDRTQSVLTVNTTRQQAIHRELAVEGLSQAARLKFEVELAYLQANNEYNQIQLRGNEDLTRLYQIQQELTALELQLAQYEQTLLQTAINDKNLAEKQTKLESLAEEQGDSQNSFIERQRNLNVRISAQLLKHTADFNRLSQEDIRIKNLLDSLQQSQRNLDEQIIALKGSLVLSRVIDKERQSLSKDELISGISEQISDLRVQIFDINEFRSNFQDTDKYIEELAQTNKVTLTDDERSILKALMNEANQGVSDVLKVLNNQLTLLINIDLNQQQIKEIRTSIENKLQEQSFWVQSNTPFGLTWLKTTPDWFSFQVRSIKKQFDFSNWQDNIVSASLLIALFGLLFFLLQRQRDNIKQRLNRINHQLRAVETESHWHTPIALFWTVLLCLPSTFLFLIVFVTTAYICFKDPMPLWGWCLQMGGYWFYFTFMLALLRPNGIAHRHFKLPQQTSENFRRILKRSAWLIALLLNARIFMNLETGVAYDVIGEVMTLTVLVLAVVLVIPEIRRALASYRSTLNENESNNIYLLSFLSILLLLVPIVMIGLIALGYYYTSVILIEHFMASYFALTTWLIIRAMIYRHFEVSARRLAYRRLQEKREKLQAELAEREQAGEVSESEKNNEFNIEIVEEGLNLNQVRSQVLNLVDFVLWIALFGLFSWVWSDLLAVAGYLDGISLWKQVVTTETGTTLEAVTLLNLLMALVIILATYFIVRNLAGLLEVLVFSNLNLSQGTPYTITTLLTYLIITLGAALSFGMLGMSWSKLQWLFAALSVGLGFGMQEIFANFVSGIIILFERPVRIGDTITIDNFSGKVSKIRIRATTLVDFDGKEVIVPNKAFVTERLVNWALSNNITRVVVNVGVAYGSDLELVKQLLLRAANECESVLREPEPSAYFLSFGASTLDHELRVYVGQLSDRVPTQDALNRKINRLFAEHNIEIAFNQLDVYLKNTDTNEEVKVLSKQL